MSGFCDFAATTSDSSSGFVAPEALLRHSSSAIGGLGLRGLRRTRRFASGARRADARSPAQGRLVVLAVHVNAQFPGRDSQGGTRRSQDRQEFLLGYVREVQPQVMEDFVQTAPPQVIDAMQHTVGNMLGSLPPQFFDVRISTMGENLTQLMYSVMMTGYMFRNAQYRLELHRSLGLLPFSKGDDGQTSGEPYASKAQKTKVQGEVVRWHKDTGAESMSAVQYIEQLEDKLRMLRGQLEEQRTEIGQNDLLEYIKALEPKALKELTKHAGEEVLLAMSVFIQRLMGTKDNTELQTASCDSTVIELARLLYWLMVVGYSLRTWEVRLDMDWAYNQPISTQLPEDGI